jgi:hypothetical protein
MGTLSQRLDSEIERYHKMHAQEEQPKLIEHETASADETGLGGPMSISVPWQRKRDMNTPT